MGLETIIIIALIGFGLLLAEIFIIPGTTVTGIGGFVALIAAVWLSYNNFPLFQANLITLIIAIAFTLLLWKGFGIAKSGKLAVNETIQSKVQNKQATEDLINMEGVALTTLRPAGKISINNQKIDAYSVGEYIEKEAPVVVRHIKENKIYVQSIKK